MAVKLIAFDFDDTLLDSEKKIPKRNLEAISRAREAGIILVPASGRLIQSQTRYLEEMAISGPVITCNGAQVIDTVTGESLFESDVAYEDVCKVLVLAKEWSLYTQLYRSGEVYYDTYCSYSEYYERTADIRGSAVGDLEAFAEKEKLNSQKILMIDTPERVAEVLPILQKELPQLMVMTSRANFIEINNPAANKGAALQAIAERYGFTRDEVMAIGDSGNDRSMLEYAGQSVAVGNAKPEIKALCRYIAPDCEEGGVGIAIDRWALGLEV